MSLPFSAQQIFFVAIIVFVVIGFQRGWKRELVSLVFILLAAFLVNQGTSVSVGTFLSRLPLVIGYAANGNQALPETPVGVENASLWSLLIFVVIVGIGYVVGNRAFPRPTTPHERFIGIVPSVIGGAFILGYVGNYFKATGGQSSVTVSIQAPDPANFITIIFLVTSTALLIALIAARTRKTAKK